MPHSKDWLLPIGRHYAPQCGHIDFETVTSDKCPGCFINEAAEEGASHFVYPGFQVYVFYSTTEKCALAMTLYMERATIPTLSVFFGNGHLQHAVAGREGSFCLHYHTYFITSHTYLKNAIYFPYAASFFI